MSIERISTKPVLFELVDQFYTSFTINTAAVTQGFHTIYTYSAPGIVAEELFAQYYCRSDYTAQSNNEDMRETPSEIFFAVGGTPASVIPQFKITNGQIIFGYASLASVTPDSPNSTAYLQGFIFKT